MKQILTAAAAIALAAGAAFAQNPEEEEYYDIEPDDINIEQVKADAAAGNTDAMTELGNYYCYGEYGLERNPEKGWELINKAAELGNGKALYDIALHWKSFGNTERNIAKHEEYLIKSADTGYLEAITMLGYLYRFGDSEGNFPPNPDKAIYYYLQAADTGDTYSMLNVGELYEEIGFWKGAVEYYRKAIDTNADYTPARVNLGRCYEMGRGVEKDIAKALEQYKMAADENMTARYYIARFQEKGIMVPKDAAAAVKVYKEAADNYISEAAYDLGLCYYNGVGVPKDAAKAKEYLEQAAQGGVEEAKKFIEEHF